MADAAGTTVLDASYWFESGLLKTWARQSAPSLYERHRNETISEVQGNRNPLIDFPEWIDRIFNTSIGTTLFIGAVCLQVLGLVWVNRLVRAEQ